jgi:hypothetical protein
MNRRIATQRPRILAHILESRRTHGVLSSETWSGLAAVGQLASR